MQAVKQSARVCRRERQMVRERCRGKKAGQYCANLERQV